MVGYGEDNSEGVNCIIDILKYYLPVHFKIMRQVQNKFLEYSLYSIKDYIERTLENANSEEVRLRDAWNISVQNGWNV